VGFVVLKRPPVSGGAALGRGFEGRSCRLKRGLAQEATILTQLEQVRAAVRHAADLGETMIAIIAEAADELAYVQDEIANDAYLTTAQHELASAKLRTEAAVARLREWLCSDLAGGQ
jgi:hypothetical protein